MAALSFDLLFRPIEQVDAWLTGLFDGASLLVALGIALLLGLRHASDPDHLVAVTSMVAADGGDPRGAARLGAWWGLGHAAVLLGLGVPLIVLKSQLPSWLEGAAETAIGIVIVVLAGRVILKWIRGDYRADRHPHVERAGDSSVASHRHLHETDLHRHRAVRTSRQALGIGILHGLAGTGAVVVLLLAALPTRLESALALAVFAPMSVASMAACTTALAWLLTRTVVAPIYRTVLIPASGLFGIMFGVWYAGLG